MEGQGTNGLVVGSAQTRAIQRKVPGSRAWTSFLECVSATGVALPLVVVFKGGSLQQQWFPLKKDEFEQWRFTTTETGWTNNAVALEWLQKTFIPYTQPEDPSQPRLLILDSHDSHKTEEFMWTCLYNNIQLLFLPPHTSHVLQPLDISVFSPLKYTYRKYLNEITSWTELTVQGKQLMIRCIVRAQKEAMTAQNIRAGWRASGLWPININKPLSSRLLLENSNPVADIEKISAPREAPGPVQSSQPSKAPTEPIVDTPQRKSDLHYHLNDLVLQNRHPCVRRLQARKVEKAFDERDFKLAQALQEIEALKAQLEAAQPSKRKRVVTDPNERFATIQLIHQAQIEAGRIKEPAAEESDSESTDSVASCIVVS